jgi:hypothetical protein
VVTASAAVSSVPSWSKNKRSSSVSSRPKNKHLSVAYFPCPLLNTLM